jgi:hypothetical protein
MAAGKVCDALGARLSVLPQALTWFAANDPAYHSHCNSRSGYLTSNAVTDRPMIIRRISLVPRRS